MEKCVQDYEIKCGGGGSTIQKEWWSQGIHTIKEERENISSYENIRMKNTSKWQNYKNMKIAFHAETEMQNTT